MNIKLKNALVKAALDAEVITKRDNQINSRAARIGNFITCFRREMGLYMNDKYIQPGYQSGKYTKLTSHDTWNFILELNKPDMFCNEIVEAIEKAKLEVYGNGTIHGNLSFQLKNIQYDVSSMQTILDRINSINTEANSIITDFRELAKQL